MEVLSSSFHILYEKEIIPVRRERERVKEGRVYTSLRNGNLFVLFFFPVAIEHSSSGKRWTTARRMTLYLTDEAECTNFTNKL